LWCLVVNNYKPPEHVDKTAHPRNKEHKPKKEEPMAKPHGIERKGNKYKVFLEYDNKRIHIGYKKTLEEAEALLEQAKQESGVE